MTTRTPELMLDIDSLQNAASAPWRRCAACAQRSAAAAGELVPREERRRLAARIETRRRWARRGLVAKKGGSSPPKKPSIPPGKKPASTPPRKKLPPPAARSVGRALRRGSPGRDLRAGAAATRELDLRRGSHQRQVARRSDPQLPRRRPRAAAVRQEEVGARLSRESESLRSIGGSFVAALLRMTKEREAIRPREETPTSASSPLSSS